MGTGGTQAYTDDPPEPNTSDDVIVSKTIYNGAGLVEQVVDNAGRVTKFVHDDAFRRTHVIENYKSGGTYWTSEPDAPKARAADEVRITQTDYNANGQVVRLVAIDPDADGNTSDNQVTQYIYSAELTDKGTPSGGIMSNSMLRAVIKPDSDDTVASSALSDGADSTYDRIEHTYYANGTPRTRKDHRGNVITYAHYDDGMMKAQTVTTLSGSTDGHVRALTYTYNDLRQPEKLTSHGNATDDPTNTTSIRNQIQYAYNGMHQMITEYQQHGGAVVTSGGGESPKVQYDYDNTTVSHRLVDLNRLEKIVYPNGREVFYIYGSNDSVWDRVSQVRYLYAEGQGTAVTVAYDYVGASTIVETDYREADISLDFANTNYTNLDRFGRPIEQWWNDYGASPDVDAVRIKHGYDRAGNVMYREDVVAAANSVDFDEFYGHDELHRLNDYALGALNGTYDGLTGTAASEQDFTYDQLGNWSQFVEKASGVTTLDQTRAHNAANEIGVIGATTGANWADAAHDASGNMTTVPKPDDPANAFTVIYDAWNRTVKIVDASSSDAVAEYRYDALNRRERELVYISGSLDHTRHFYFSASWQVLEERLDSETRADRQYVWGLRYVDDLVLRDRDADGNSGTGDLGIEDGGLEERLYALNDASFNIIALADNDGDIVKRFRYTPYGQRIALDPDFTTYTGADYDWHHGFQGLAHDPRTGSINNRTREWWWHIGRYGTMDWTGYPDGLNAYAGYHVMWGGVDAIALAAYVHRAEPEAALNILQNGFRPGKENLIWLSSKASLLGGRSMADACVELTLELGDEIVPDGTISKQLAHQYYLEARDALKEAVTDPHELHIRADGARWARIRSELAKMPGNVFKISRDGGHFLVFRSNTHLFKGRVMGIRGIGETGRKAVEQIIEKLNALRTVGAQGNAIRNAATGEVLDEGFKAKWGRRLGAAGRIGGRALIVVGIASDGYQIYVAEDKVREVVKTVGGFTGAWAGAKAGAMVGGGGALVGGQLGPQALAPEEIVTVPVGATVGAFVGAAVGYWAGSEITELAYDTYITPGVPLDNN